jgi:hypothetical protein
MKRGTLFVALVAAAAMAAQPGWARTHHRHGRQVADGVCSRSAQEAEQAIRYITDLMVASSACRDTTYAKFALRNRLAIIHYQRAMIVRLHGTAAFDRWNTVLANEEAMKQAAVPIVQFCSAAQPLLKQASAFDPHGFEAYAAAQAAHADPPGASCRR